MNLVGTLRRAARALVRRPTWGRFAAASAVPPATALAALLVTVLAVLAGWEQVRDWCAANRGTTSDDYAACFAANAFLVRAPLTVGLALVMGLAMLGFAAVASLPPLAQAALARRRRDDALRDRLARLEDAYARGALGETLYAEARAQLERGLRRGVEADVALAERRLLAWILFGTAPVLATAVGLGVWASGETFGMGGPVLPWAWLVVLSLAGTTFALLAAAWWQARQEASGVIAESERDLDALWARVLAAAREASARPPAREAQ